MLQTGHSAGPNDHAPYDVSQLEWLLQFGRGVPLPDGLTAVHETIAELARTRPTATAVHSGDASLNYGQLDAWAAHIATRLAAAGTVCGSHVLVLAEPSAAMIAAVLGVLKCGAAYVPVDPAQPDGRLRRIASDARVSAAVVTGALRDRDVFDVAVVSAEEALDASPDGSVPPDVAVTGVDPAYVIYTSGSTGEPKGVVVEHRNLAASTAARHLVYPGAPTFLMVSPLAFDSSVAGIWGTLTAGGRLVVPGSADVRDAQRLLELIEHHEVTHVLCVPSLYAVLLDAAEQLGVGRLRSLDTVIVAGEPLPEALMRRHFAVHRDRVSLVNEYGPTEASVWASYRRCTATEPVSIGGPVPGAALYVLDESMRPVPDGFTGELFIGGAGVARGYLGRPDLTGRAFVADPFVTEPYARMYRTGDLVRWTAAGTLEFVGRRDHQVKIRGHRVELGAVEAVIRSLAGVREAVVEPDDARTTLRAFVVTTGDLSLMDIRQHVADQLPAAMVPSRVTVVDSLPLSLTGKVDRAALRALPEPGCPEPVPSPTPVNGGDMTARVTAAWVEVLEVPSVPTDSNFFDVGGHSLTLFKLQNALERHTGHRPSIVNLFQHSTVRAQADFISSGGLEAGNGPGQPGGRRRIGAAHARQQRARQEIAR